ncbi:MAG: hypothetical protein ACRC2T_14450, partial [Thermoguttaceae bacterium]
MFTKTVGLMCDLPKKITAIILVLGLFVQFANAAIRLPLQRSDSKVSKEDKVNTAEERQKFERNNRFFASAL